MDLNEVLKRAREASPNGVLERVRNASSNLMALLPNTKVFNSVDKAASELVNAWELLDELLTQGIELPDAWMNSFVVETVERMKADLR